MKNKEPPDTPHVVCAPRHLQCHHVVEVVGRVQHHRVGPIHQGTHQVDKCLVGTSCHHDIVLKGGRQGSSEMVLGEHLGGVVEGVQSATITSY